MLNKLLVPFGPFVAAVAAAAPPVIKTFLSDVIIVVAGRLAVRLVSAALGDPGLFY